MYPHPDVPTMLVDEATCGTAAQYACCQTSAAVLLPTSGAHLNGCFCNRASTGGQMLIGAWVG